MSKNKLSNDWPVQSVSDLFYIGSGEAASYRSNDLSGPVLVYGANGPIGSYDYANYGPGYIIGRVGTTGEVTKVSFRVWASDNTLTATPKVGVCDHDFGGYLLEFLNLPRLATKNAQPLLTQTNIASLCAIISENVEEQRRIAEILDTIDKAIQKTEALISKLKAMKQGLLHDLLTRGLDENGNLRDPKAHPEEFKDSPLGRIPKEWDVINLGDSFEELYRYPTYYGIEYVGHGVPEVRGELVKEDGTMEEKAAAYRYINRETADRFPMVRLEPGDFVMSVRGTMGKIAIVPKRLRGAVITANLIRMKFTKSVVVSEWARHFLRSAFFQDALDLVTSATTIKTIQVSQLCSIPFRRPFIDEQIRIADVLDTHDSRIRTEEQYRDKLKLQKKGLMHDLLTGKVRVNV